MKPGNRTRWWILAASHLAMAIAGFMLSGQPRAGDAPDADSKPASGSTTLATSASSNDKGASRKGVSFKPSTSWHGGEYARAWKAVQHARLSTPERLRVQRELLEKWAEIDLTAAIDAALAEAWDSDDAGYYDRSGPLLGALSKAIARDAAGVWEMIRGRQFGVGTGMLRYQWIHAVGKSDPLFLASKMGEVSWRDRTEVLNACTQDAESGSEMSKKLFAVLASFPEDIVDARALLNLSDTAKSGMSPEQRRQEILALSGQDARMAQVRAVQWGRTLAGFPASDLEAQVTGMPEALREEVTWAAFSSSGPTENQLGFATLLVNQGAWDKLEDIVMTRHLQNLAGNGFAEAVADWATGLPVRKETTELFHRSVDRYLRENMEGAREWLADIPPGVWRDRAYAEYSQQALHAHNNPEASRWALDQIGDTTFKGEAESWRRNWEKRTGWQAQ